MGAHQTCGGPLFPVRPGSRIGHASGMNEKNEVPDGGNEAADG